MIHHKVNHIDALSVGLALRREAVGRIGLKVDLHRWRPVCMEGAAEHAILIRLQPIMPQHLGDRETGFEIGKGHLKGKDEKVDFNSYLCQK